MGKASLEMCSIDGEELEIAKKAAEPEKNPGVAEIESLREDLRNGAEEIGRDGESSKEVKRNLECNEGDIDHNQTELKESIARLTTDLQGTRELTPDQIESRAWMREGVAICITVRVIPLTSPFPIEDSNQLQRIIVNVSRGIRFSEPS